MESVSLEELAPHWATALVVEPGGVDRWCSSMLWSRSVQRAFAPDSTLLAGIGGGSSCVAFARYPLGDSAHALVPLDLVWSFGSPVLGIADRKSARDVANFLHRDGARAVFVGGLIERSATWQALVETFGDHHRLIVGEERVRCRASLVGGVDGYLSRRSREFRRNLRQAERRIATSGVRIEVLDDVAAKVVMNRLANVEQESWKGQEGSGIVSHDMASLYGFVAGELAQSGGLRVAVAVSESDGRDLAFILGGIQGETYRGMQLSFVEDARSLGLGNYLQWHQIQRLCANEKEVCTYDLGMDMAYKRAWSETLHTTRTLVAVS